MDANSGRIATQILIRKPQETVDDDGFPIIGHEYLFNGKPVWCEWVNAHGSEFYNAASLNLREPATLQRSPTFTKLISGFTSSSSSPESHIQSGLATGV